MNTLFSPRRRPLWLALALLVLACAAWLGTGRVAHSAKPAETAAPPVQATTTQVRQQDVPIVRSGVGTVTPLATVTVRSRIDGQLERVGFVEGQDVKAGQLLAQLDARALKVQLQQAQAQKAKDAALLGNARVDLKRYETLIAQDAAAGRLSQIQSLMGQINATSDQKAVQEIQARIGAENAMLAHEMSQLQMLQGLADSEERIARSRDRERQYEMLARTGKLADFLPAVAVPTIV